MMVGNLGSESSGCRWIAGRGTLLPANHLMYSPLQVCKIPLEIEGGESLVGSPCLPLVPFELHNLRRKNIFFEQLTSASCDKRRCFRYVENVPIEKR
jgi:hypothetical protein